MELIYLIYLWQLSWMLMVVLVGGFAVLTVSDVIKELVFKKK